MEQLRAAYRERGGGGLSDLLRGASSADDELQPLDDAQLATLVPKTPLKTYGELIKDPDILRFLKNGRGVLLYEIESATEGHWVGMLLRPGRVLEYFDSYGHRPDEPLSWIPARTRDKLDEGHPELSAMLRRAAAAGWKVVFNTRPFQDRANHSLATCGRHVACRLAWRDLSLADYGKLVDSVGMAPDDFVTAATQYALSRSGLKGGVTAAHAPPGQ